jgi:hypothetical protein
MACACERDAIPRRKFTWDSEDVCLDGEDTPFIDMIERIGGKPDSPLELFLDMPAHSPRGFYEQNKLQAICSAKALRELKLGICELPPDLVVWMDDRSKEGGPRDYNGLMSVKKWHDTSKLKVSKDSSRKSG